MANTQKLTKLLEQKQALEAAIAAAHDEARTGRKRRAEEIEAAMRTLEHTAPDLAETLVRRAKDLARKAKPAANAGKATSAAQQTRPARRSPSKEVPQETGAAAPESPTPTVPESNKS